MGGLREPETLLLATALTQPYISCNGTRGNIEAAVADLLFVAARVISEDVSLVEGDAHEEHGQPPAQRAEHALLAVVLNVFLQVSQRRRVSKCDSRCAEELTCTS